MVCEQRTGGVGRCIEAIVRCRRRQPTATRKSGSAPRAAKGRRSASADRSRDVRPIAQPHHSISNDNPQSSRLFAKPMCLLLGLARVLITEQRLASGQILYIDPSCRHHVKMFTAISMHTQYRTGSQVFASLPMSLMLLSAAGGLELSLYATER